jgi:hypothetical protein
MKDKDLDILLPEKEIALASGEIVVITPFSFAKLPKVVSLLNSIGVGVFALLEARKGITVTEGNPDETAAVEMDDLIINKVNDFIESHFDEVTEILAIYCRRPKEFFLDEEKGPDVEEACQIVLTIVDRHLGFFTKTLRPILTRIRSKAQAGATSSES